MAILLWALGAWLVYTIHGAIMETMREDEHSYSDRVLTALFWPLLVVVMMYMKLTK